VARSRGDWVTIGFMILWMTLWTSAILVALYIFGGRVLHGEVQAALVLAIWLAGAGFGLYTAARRLHGLITVGKAPPPPMRHHRWRDGFAPPRPPDLGIGDAELAGRQEDTGAERLLREDRDPKPDQRAG
jgi:hypothetical protein